MQADPPNPYRDLPLREIFAALNERAGELLKGDKPVGRRDTAYLLLAASKWIDDRAASIGSPAHQVKQGTPIPDAFMPEYQHGLRTLRHYELQRARDAAGLDHEAVLAHQKATDTLLGQPETDDEFRAALEWLEAARRARASGAPGE